MTASDQLHQDRVEEMNRGNRRTKKKIAVALGIFGAEAFVFPFVIQKLKD